MAASTAITRGAPKCSPGACWPSTVDGRVTSAKVATSGAGRASAGWAAHVEVVADELLEERPPGRRPVKHSGVGDLELAERQLVDPTRAQIVAGQRGRQPTLPAPEEALHRARPEPVADPL